MRRVLITGGEGMLGRALVESRPADCSVLAVDVDELDVADAGAVRRGIADFHPNAVIHCAALTNVDGCETDPEAAWRINVQGVENVAAACSDAVRLIHISTDFVFDGCKTEPYTEDDSPAPISVYGRTKLESEARVRALAANHAVVRTAWTFAPWGHNFVRSILRAAREKGRLRVVDDQTGSPTYAPDLAQALWPLANQDRRGTFHLTNFGVVSRYEFACEIVAIAGMSHVAVEPIESADLAQLAARPAYSALANTKLPPLRHYREALEECIAFKEPQS